MDFSAVLGRLRDRLVEQERNLMLSQESFGDFADYVEDEVHDDDHPVLTAMLSNDPNSIQVCTNFTLDEFRVLWSQVESAVLPTWNLGRGRRHQTSAIDAFVMSLTVLKHYDNWSKHASDFGMKTPTFEKMVNKMFTLVEPYLFQFYVNTSTMTEYRRTNTQFRHYKYALYATDVKFQPANRPTGRFLEQKHYFSGIFLLHEYNTDFSLYR